MRPGSFIVFAGSILAVLLAPGPAAPRADDQQRVDLELVLAVDTSSSVDDAEFRLQLEGIAAAFRDPAVVEAIGAGAEGRIAVALELWAQPGLPKYATDWQVVGDRAGAAAFADTVAGQHRPLAGDTGIAAGLLFALDLINENGFQGARRVIDLSGDGRETSFQEGPTPLQEARDQLRRFGVTVNGLAILNDDPGLAAYYREQVIDGPGAFVMTAADYTDFAEAMRQKLLREIALLPQVSRLTSHR